MRRSLLITAGPTREKIDPVRFISNYSTGTFGYEIAREALRRKYRVTLVSGPVAIKPPADMKFIAVESALEMRHAVLKEFARADCVIMASAVSDWRPAKATGRKMKKGTAAPRLALKANPDILAELGRRKGKKVIIGFALETEDLEKNALEKLKEKNLDLIVANKPGRGGQAFGDNLTSALLIDRFGNKMAYAGKTKKELAKIILDKLETINIY